MWCHIEYILLNVKLHVCLLLDYVLAEQSAVLTCAIHMRYSFFCSNIVKGCLLCCVRVEEKVQGSEKCLLVVLELS